MTLKRKAMEAVPGRELDVFDDMDRWFDTLFRRGGLRSFRDLWPEAGNFGEPFEAMLPQVDLIDREEEILVRAELPGVEKKDLRIDLSGDVLTLEGERRQEEKTEKGEVYRAEIRRGTFRRMIRLPRRVDFEKAAADFKDGMLEVHLPKLQKTEHRRIEIQ